MVRLYCAILAFGFCLSGPARASIEGLPPAGYFSSEGYLESPGSEVVTGTHFYTFWTTARLGEQNRIEYSFQIIGKIHDDADICCWGYMFNSPLPPVVVDQSPLTSPGRKLYSASAWVTLPQDTETYIPNEWGPGNGGTRRIHYIGIEFLGGYYGANSAGQPFWLTVDDPDAMRAVPEPATWAMLTAGFVLAGSALRRRRHRIA